MDEKEKSEMREQLIYGKAVDWSKQFGGIIWFEGMTVETLKDLIEKDLVDLEEQRNDSPSTEEFYEFMKLDLWNSDMTCHGYLVSPTRPDCRLTIEGLSFNSPVNEEMLIKFAELNRMADEFILSSDYLYSWWD